MSTDATRCKVCGGPFAAKRVLIDGEAYHERCSFMSYPSHTHEDYSKASDEIARLRGLLNGRDDFIVRKGLWSEFTDGLPRS